MQPLWFPAPWPWIKPTLNTMCSNHQAGHDLDLNISAKEQSCSQPPSRATLHQLHPLLLLQLYLTPFTLHFTADIISQISAHLARILTDFDGLGEESHPSCCKPLFYQTLWLIRTALALNSHVLINLCERDTWLDPNHHNKSQPKQNWLMCSQKQ